MTHPKRVHERCNVYRAKTECGVELAAAVVSLAYRTFKKLIER